LKRERRKHLIYLENNLDSDLVFAAKASLIKKRLGVQVTENVRKMGSERGIGR